MEVYTIGFTKRTAAEFFGTFIWKTIPPGKRFKARIVSQRDQTPTN